MMPEQVFVARERELSQLQGYLDRALGGQGQVVFVTGEAGAGKTALVTEFARRAQAEHDDLVVAVGDCNAQTGIGDPYLPFREVLGLLTGDVEGKLTQGAITGESASRLRDFLRVSGHVLVDLGPDLIDILVPGVGLATRAGTLVAGKVGWLDRLDDLLERKALRQAQGDGGSGPDQSRIFEQYTNVLRALAEQQPLMLVLDDLHWSDASSIELLFHLGRRIGEARILLAGTYRPEDVAVGRGGSSAGHGGTPGQRRRHPLESVASEFKRYYGDIWVRLGQADEAAGRQFVDALVDTEPNRLGEGFRQALFRHTGAHPLFTGELLRDMQERGDLIRDEEGVWVETSTLDWEMLPARVEGVIETRIGRLEEALRETLTVASVEGEDFTAEVVARVRAAGAGELVRQLSGELEKRHRLVSAQGFRRLGAQRLSVYRFRHNLFQRYLYNSLNEVERAYLHEDVGNVLEALYEGQTGEVAVQLAWHFEAAGMAKKALEYLSLAGERARALYAPREAVEHLAHAFDIADRLSVTPPAHLYRARGQAYQTLGEFERAQADYGAALAGAEATDDRQTAWQALLDLGLLWASRDYAQAGDYFRQALERARALGDRATVAHSLNRLGNWHMNIDQPREGLRYHEEALAIFEGLHDRRGIAETLDLLGLASGMGGDLVQATAYFEEAVALFRELDDRQALSSSLATRIVLGWAYRTETMVPGAADLAACARDGEMALEIARDIGWRAGEAYALLELGYYLGPHGDYARALGYARAGLEVAQDIEHRQWMTGAYCALGALHLDLLALPQARQHLEQALALAKEVGSRHWFRTATGHLAGVYILEDDLALAEQILDDALSVDTPCRTIGQRIVWCARGELALAAGDPALALQVADLLIATASNLTPEQAIPWVGRLRGEALTALGRTDEAEVELHAAQETAHALGVLPMLWRIHVALGKLYRATARPEEAEGEFRAARAIIEELAANIPDEALRENFLQQATYG